MKQTSGPAKAPAEALVKDIRRATRRHFSAEEKIRLVLEGLRGEDSIAELCRREGITSSQYYGWSKEFLEAGKRRLAGDTARAATSDEVKGLRREASALKEVVADLTLENRLLKKACSRMGRTGHEVSGLREAGDHRLGRAVPSARPANAGEARDPARHVLQVVRPVPDRRPRGAGGPLVQAKPGLEPHPRRDPKRDHRPCPGAAGAL